ncbi:hypothetical protein AAG906_039583 [Vitis piasezkii]
MSYGFHRLRSHHHHHPFLYLRRSHISHFTSNFRSGSRVCFSNNGKISSYPCHDYRNRVKFKRFECRAEDSYTNNKEISKGTLIWRAIKLPIYSVALGSGSGFSLHGTRWDQDLEELVFIPQVYSAGLLSHVSTGLSFGGSFKSTAVKGSGIESFDWFHLVGCSTVCSYEESRVSGGTDSNFGMMSSVSRGLSRTQFLVFLPWHLTERLQLLSTGAQRTGEAVPAYLQTGLFSARQYFTLLASSVLIIAWLNLSNDVYDFDTGADKNKKESVVNMVGSRTGTHAAAYALLALGFVGLSWASMVAGNFRAILLLACAVTCGYIYQCPPFRLSYQGLGEPLCFAAFGPFATTAFYLMQTATSEMISPLVTATVLSASLLVGFTTTLILFCSHFHQVEGDRAVGKMSPLDCKMAMAMLYSLLLAFGLAKLFPSLFSCALTIPMAKLVVSYVEDNHKDNSKIFMAKYYCVRLHALFGAALAAGLVAARLLTKR